MERTSTFQTGLIMAAFLVVVAAIGLVLLAPALGTASVSVPAPKAQATKQEMEEAWENLVDAIRREDQAEALRLAERLDELQKAREIEANKTTPVTNLRIVQLWCEMGGYKWDFCKEESNAK